MSVKSCLSTIIVTYGRDEALRRTVARLAGYVSDRKNHELILVDNNADGLDRSHMMSELAGKYVRMERNEGVTGGRNAGIKAAPGNILVFLDDDSLLEGPMDFYDRLAGRFDDMPTLAALAFRIWLRDPEVSDPAEFPHTDKSLPRDQSFETFRYVGAGHAVRSAAFEECGLYPESFFYGMEEFEMSYRFLNAGLRIVYDPNFTVTHMKAPTGRLPRKDVVERMYANKLFIAWRHLPLPQALLCAAAWGVKTCIDARSPLSVLRAFRAFTKNAVSERASRRPFRLAVNRIAEMGGQSWK